MDTESFQTGYFSSYEDLEIHKLMLEDAPRTNSYREAILANKEYFRDKIVMDVGCGTGILSIFCAQAGAKKVYAVEASSLVDLARNIVKENSFENIIEVIHSKVEEVSINIKVDIIVSEWMGFYLLHEGMLDSLLVARDKFLKEDGVMFPEEATIYVAPCSIPSLYDQWTSIYGVSMTEFAKLLRSSKTKPEILTVKPEHLLAKETALCSLKLKEVKVEELEVFTMKQVIACSSPGNYQGLCIWFDCNFPNLTASGDHKLLLSTSPLSVVTHWKQTVIVLPEEQEVESGEPVAFQLDLYRDQVNPRRYNIQVIILDSDKLPHPTPCPCHMTKCILIRTFMEQHHIVDDDEDIIDCTGEAKPSSDDCNGIVDEEIIDDDD